MTIPTDDDAAPLEVPETVTRNLFDDDRARLDGADTTRVILTCGICGEEIDGPAAGRGSAVYKLGTHRFVKHKVRKGDRPARPRAGAPNADDLAGADRTRTGQVISLVRDMADGAGGGRVDRPPTSDELTKGLGRGVSITTVLLASYLAETDPAIPEDSSGDAEREALVDYLSLPQKSAEDVVAPLGRAFAPTRLNKKYGRAVIRNVDVVGSFGELASYTMHLRRYLATRRQGGGGAPGAHPGAPLYAVDAPPAMPAQPPIGMGGAAAATTPGPTAGRVIGPDDVARMRAAQQQGRA